MTNTTSEAVRLVNTVEGEEGVNIFVPGTTNRFYQTEDGTTVVSSWSPADDEFGAHAMAWPAQDESGYPSGTYIMQTMFKDEDEYAVYGDDTDETHNAALAQQGYHVEAQEAAA